MKLHLHKYGDPVLRDIVTVPHSPLLDSGGQYFAMVQYRECRTCGKRKPVITFDRIDLDNRDSLE